MALNTRELLKKVRQVEIKTRGLTNQIFSGEYHSTFKGRGMMFSEVREYAHGDEIRTIDWNVTARFNQPFVKIFEEERELTFILLVDISGSENFGTNEQTKRELVTELSAVLAFSASKNNDKVGIILFSDKIEKFIPPQKGKPQILRIIRELIEFQPEEKKTDIGAALKYLNNVMKRRAIVFLISDFMDTDYTKPLSIAAKKHDLVALQISDRREKEMPSMGFVQFMDPETGETFTVNTSSKKFRKKFLKERENFQQETENIFKKLGVDYATVDTGESYIPSLINLFRRRSHR